MRSLLFAARQCACRRVYLCRKKKTGDVYAVKVLAKCDMIRKNQVFPSTIPPFAGTILASSPSTHKLTSAIPSPPSSLLPPCPTCSPYPCGPQVDRVRAEQRILSTLRNPFIVDCFFSFQTKVSMRSASSISLANSRPPPRFCYCGATATERASVSPRMACRCGAYRAGQPLLGHGVPARRRPLLAAAQRRKPARARRPRPCRLALCP